jgi:hypothetical protein
LTAAAGVITLFDPAALAAGERLGLGGVAEGPFAAMQLALTGPVCAIPSQNEQDATQ